MCYPLSQRIITSPFALQSRAKPFRDSCGLASRCSRCTASVGSSRSMLLSSCGHAACKTCWSSFSVPYSGSCRDDWGSVSPLGSRDLMLTVGWCRWVSSAFATEVGIPRLSAPVYLRLQLPLCPNYLEQAQVPNSELSDSPLLSPARAVFQSFSWWVFSLRQLQAPSDLGPHYPPQRMPITLSQECPPSPSVTTWAPDLLGSSAPRKLRLPSALYFASSGCWEPVSCTLDNLSD